MKFIEHLRRLSSIVHRNRVESGLDEEIGFHIEQQTAKNIRAGMAPDEARRQAFIRFGGVEHVKEQTRDQFRPALAEEHRIAEEGTHASLLHRPNGIYRRLFERQSSAERDQRSVG